MSRSLTVTSFEEAVRTEPFLLADGGLETRIVFGTSYRMDPVLEVARMVSDPKGRPLLREIYAGYAEIARRSGLPMILGTPTFRASPDRLRRAGFPETGAVREINQACFDLLEEVRREYQPARIFIAGVIGPRGDAYQPEEALTEAEAETYHRPQAEALAAAGVDFLFAPTFPALPEAVGVARAMAATGLPHVVSFVLGLDGAILDGTRLPDAVRAIDAAVSPAPLHYSLSCVHPTIAERALEAAEDPDLVRRRVLEIKANGSPLGPAELDGLGRLESDPPAEWADALWRVHERFGLKVLGGCCGTDDRHIAALADRMRPAGS